MAYRDQKHQPAKIDDGWDGTYEPYCKAYGCPLPAGTISDYAHYRRTGSPRMLPSAGVCSYHWSANGDEWQAVTRVIRQHLVLLATMNALHSGPKIEVMHMQPETIEGDPGTTPYEGEGMFAWMQRMRTLVHQRIRERIPQEKGGRAAHAPESLQALSKRIAASMRDEAPE